MAEIQIDGYKCERCGHEWVKRSERKTPIICPKCKSPYWSEPRKEKQEKTEE
jgi:DNA-directed RNA polymerase subunit RPC12/RpoP